MRLKSRERIPILVHYYQDVSVEEIAHILCISRSAVYYRLKQAQKRLHIIIEEGISMYKRQFKEALDLQFSPLVFDARQHERVLSLAKGEPRMTRKISLAAALAAVLLLALSATALAALGGNVLSYLWQSKPTQAQQDSVQAVGAFAESGGVRVTLTDCLYDGLCLSGGLTFESESPVFVWNMRAASPVGEIWMDFASPMQSWNVNSITGVSGPWDNDDHGFLAYLDEGRMQKATALDTLPVTLTLSCMRPAKALRQVDHEPPHGTSEHDAWQAQVDALFAEGYTVVYASETGHAQLYPSHCDHGTALEGFPQHANLVPLKPIVLQFEVDTRRALAATKDVTPSHVDNDGRYAFTFHEVLLTPLTTWFHFTVTPNPPFTTAEELMELMQWFEFYDEQHRPLAIQEGEYFAGVGFEEQPDGSLALVAAYPLPALDELPEGIYIVPRNYVSERPLWEYAVYVPVK